MRALLDAAFGGDAESEVVERLRVDGDFVLSLVAELIMAWTMYGLLFHTGNFSARAGVITGAIVWFGFVLTTVAVNNAYPGRKLMLTAIDSVHWLGVLVIIGAIVGGFGG